MEENKNTMANKRLTDTSIWKRQRWFRKLSPAYKLAFMYIKDNCDHAGLWKMDVMELLEDTGLEELDIKDLAEKVNTEFNKFTGKKEYKERIIFTEKHLVLTGFLNFQYQSKNGTVNTSHVIARHAIDILRAHDLMGVFIEREYAVFSEELPEHREKKLRKKERKSPKEKKKEELNEQATYLNILEDVEEFESRMTEATKIKRVEIIRDEMKASETLLLSAQKTSGITEEETIMETIDWFCNIIMGSNHYLKDFKEVKRYFINKLNYAQRKMKEDGKQKIKGADKQLEALKEYIQ